MFTNECIEMLDLVLSLNETDDWGDKSFIEDFDHQTQVEYLNKIRKIIAINSKLINTIRDSEIVNIHFKEKNDSRTFSSLINCIESSKDYLKELNQRLDYL